MMVSGYIVIPRLPSTVVYRVGAGLPHDRTSVLNVLGLPEKKYKSVNLQIVHIHPGYREDPGFSIWCQM